jgi:two-component system OmpR family response regulator
MPDWNGRMDGSCIAVVEDDREIRAMIVELLRREGFVALGCASVAEFDQQAARQRIDLVLLDLMLPGEDGLSLCRRLRARGDMAVLIVSARGEDIDRIVGLEIGADDYLAKPFNPRELLARARAILRRTRERQRVANVEPGERFRFAGWTIDAGSRTLLAPDGADVALTGGEFDLLLCFVTRPQRVLNRDQLLDWTRGRSANAFDRAVDVQLSRLRRKLAAHGGGALFKTVRGGGYQFAAPVERA